MKLFALLFFDRAHERLVTYWLAGLALLTDVSGAESVCAPTLRRAAAGLFENWGWDQGRYPGGQMMGPR